MSLNSYKYILFNEKNGIGTITLNRPDQLNAFKYRMLSEIVHVIKYSMGKSSIRVLVIRGSGRSFCAGDDLKDMGEEDANYEHEKLEDDSLLPQHSVVRIIREIRKPVIALLHGHCFGAGFEVALSCDIRLAADNLIIGDHRSTRAICIVSGASWLLPRIVGFGRATEIIMTGRHLDAKEALDIGLINKMYTLSEFEEKSREFTHQIADLPTECLGYDKAMLNFSQYNELIPSLRNEINLYIENMKTCDYSEGIRSFIERRAPKFEGK